MIRATAADDQRDMRSASLPGIRASRISLGLPAALLTAILLVGVIASQALAANGSRATLQGKAKQKKRCSRRAARPVKVVPLHRLRRHSCRAGNKRAPTGDTTAGGANESIASPRGQETERQAGKPEGPPPHTEERPKPGPEPEPTPESELPLEEPNLRIFSPLSFWNAALSPVAALDPESSQIVGAFNAAMAAEVEAGRGPTINTSNWSIPLYVVPADEPTVRVIHGSEYQATALQAAWEKVPLPADAHPASGTDEHLVVWQPSTDRLWEFWRLVKETDGWHARWGGAMEHVSTNPGVYGPEAWPGSTTHWGASASSLSIAGGLMTFSDFAKGRIEHALAMAIPTVRQGTFSSPAQRTDGGSTDPLSLPEGAHLRLDPTLNLAALNLPPVTQEIAEAAQKYGIIVRSRAGHVVLYGQDPTGLTTNPYTSVGGYFEGMHPGEIMAAFPWKHLQLLKMDLRTE